MRILINIFIKTIFGLLPSLMGLTCQTLCKCVSVWLSQGDVSDKLKENLSSYNSCYISVWYMTTGVSCHWTYPQQEEQNSSLSQPSRPFRLFSRCAHQTAACVQIIAHFKKTTLSNFSPPILLHTRTPNKTAFTKVAA